MIRPKRAYHANDLLMSVLYPGVSHLFPFRTEK